MTSTTITRENHGLLRGLFRAPVAGERYWTGRRVLTWALLILIPVVMVFAPVGAAHADENDDKKEIGKLSFYNLSSAMTSMFSSAQAPNGDDDKGFSDEWLASPVLSDPGSAGSMLGYADPNISNFTGWLNSKLSGSSDSIGYDTLIPKNEDGEQQNGARGLSDYAYFGAALNGLGLDSTSTGLSLPFMGMVGGGAMMGLYFLTFVVDMVFMLIMQVLSLFNPFKLFYVGVNAVSPELAEGMTGGQTSGFGVFQGLVDWIGGWYTVLNDLSWTVMVPIFMGVFIMSALLFKSMNRMGGLKKLFIRLLFIGLGLPLLGSMYSGMLSTMTEATSAGNMGSTRVVLSTYVDFENWVMRDRLYIPDGATIEWNAGSGQPTGAAYRDVRNTALAINSQAMKIPNLGQITGGDETSWNEQAQGTNEGDFNQSVYARVNGLLWRYMSGAHITAATFETQAKGELANSDFYSKDNMETIRGWFEDYSKDDELPDKGADVQNNPVIAVAAGGGLRGSSTLEFGGEQGQFSIARSFSSDGGAASGCAADIATASGAPMNCNLSPLAMYNYLNTDFGPTSMTMYSSTNVMSEATRSIHNSVNGVGTGFMAVLYWFNSMTLLGAFVLIGFGYAFGMVIGNIRRAMQVVTAIPFATLGALAAIAKVIVYSIALILEVIITIFVYKFVQEMLISLPQIIESPFSQILNTGDEGAAKAGFLVFLMAGQGLTIVITIVSLVFTIMFTVMALRLRKTIVKAMEEATTKIVEKFMDTQVGAPSTGGKMGAMGAGVAAGAGAALANRAMTGGLGGGNSSSKKGPQAPGLGGDTGAGPQGITTEGGDGPDGGLGGGVVGGDVDTDGELSAGRAIGALPAGSGDGADGANGAHGQHGEHGAGVSGADGADGSSAAAAEAEEGRAVAERGGLSGMTDGSADPDHPRVDDDSAMSAAVDSAQDSQEKYAEADAEKLGAGKEGAQAVSHAGLAVGRAFAGDEAGAVESAGKAVEHGGQAAAAGERSKQAEADAGRSSLDAPDTRHAQNAAKAEQVSDMGRTVSAVAGAAGGTGGAAGAAGGAVPKGGSTPKAPSSGTGSSKPGSTGGIRPDTPKAPKDPGSSVNAAGGGAPTGGKPAPTGGKPAPTGGKPAPNGGKPAPKAPAPNGGKPAPKAPAPNGGKPAPKAPASGGQRPAPAPQRPAPAPQRPAPASGGQRPAPAPQRPAPAPQRPAPAPQRPAPKPAPAPKHTLRSGTAAARDSVRRARDARDAARRRRNK